MTFETVSSLQNTDLQSKRFPQSLDNFSILHESANIRVLAVNPLNVVQSTLGKVRGLQNQSNLTEIVLCNF